MLNQTYIIIAFIGILYGWNREIPVVFWVAVVLLVMCCWNWIRGKD